MSDTTLLRIDGAVARPLDLTLADLAAVDAAHQIPDVSVVDAKRQGAAVRLAALLELAGATAEATYLTLHAVRDDFHASIPLAAIRERAIVIYALAGEPLPSQLGGPIRFFIPDFAACHTHEVDECANVKFVDRMELSSQRGHDNRPLEERAHAALHARPPEPGA